MIALSGISFGQWCSGLDENMCDNMMMCEWDADAGECVQSGNGGGCSWGSWICEQDPDDDSWGCEGSGTNCNCEEGEDGNWSCEGMDGMNCDEDGEGGWNCEGSGECSTDDEGYWSCEQGGSGCSWGNWVCEQNPDDGSWDCEGSGSNCNCEEDEDGNLSCEGMGDFGCAEDEDGNWNCDGMGECGTDEDGYWSCESFEWGFGNCGFYPDSVAWGWGDWNWEDSGFQRSDINADSETNILDVVNLVNYILNVSEPTDYEYWASDINEDGMLNVLDVVSIVNQILNNRVSFTKPAAHITNNKVKLSGGVGGIQFAGELLSSLQGNDIIGSANGTTIIYNLSGNLETREMILSENYSNMIISSSAGEMVNVIENPQTFGLQNAYPNPFNPSTTISYNLSVGSHVNVSVLNMIGQKVHELVNTETIAGEYNVTWDASNYPSGMYLIKMTTPKQSAMQRVTLLK